jgi:hypothetical protein
MQQTCKILFMVQDEIVILSLDIGQAVLIGQTWKKRFSGKDYHVHRHDVGVIIPRRSKMRSSEIHMRAAIRSLGLYFNNFPDLVGHRTDLTTEVASLQISKSTDVVLVSAFD